MTTEHRMVTRASYRFDTVGAVYAIGELINGRRWIRPITAANPFPDLDSPIYPPTFVPDEEIAYAFDPAWVPGQPDLFGSMTPTPTQEAA